MGKIQSGPGKGLVIFVPETLPGDLVKCILIERKKTFARGRLIDVLGSGQGRVEPRCKISSQCGGCTWQHVDYDLQLQWKTRLVKESFRRIAGISDCAILQCIPSPKVFGYRNKVQMPLGFINGQVVAGFYEAFSHNVIPTDNCLLEHSAVRTVVKNLLQQVKKRKYKIYNEKTGRGQMRHLVARIAPGTGECMAVPVSNSHRLPGAEHMAQELMDSIPNLKSVVLNVNTKRTNVVMGDKDRLLAGNGYIVDIFGSDDAAVGLGRLKFKLSPRSFYQVNSEQAVNLYKIALDWANIGSEDVVYDIYCGIGTITLFAALKASFVVGVEDVDAAVKDARRNARDNGISNVRFVCGKSERVLPGLHHKYPRPDVVILDPPRGGADEASLNAITNLNPRTIVYVSCNPATLARDLSFLKGRKWKPDKCQPVDMFPMTPHVECVVLMSRR